MTRRRYDIMSYWNGFDLHFFLCSHQLLAYSGIFLFNYIKHKTRTACIIHGMYEDFGPRSRYLKQGLLIASHIVLWDAINYPCMRYLIQAPTSSFYHSILGIWSFWLYNLMRCHWHNLVISVLYSTFVNVNSLWRNDTIWRQSTWSTLAPVMVNHREPSMHYLHQCWLTISEVFCHSPDGNFTGNALDICHWCEFENFYCKITAASPRGL